MADDYEQKARRINAYGRRDIADRLEAAQKRLAQANEKLDDPEIQAKHAALMNKQRAAYNAVHNPEDVAPEIANAPLEVRQANMESAFAEESELSQIQREQVSAERDVENRQQEQESQGKPDGFWTKMGQRIRNLVSGKGFHDDETIGKQEFEADPKSGKEIMDRYYPTQEAVDPNRIPRPEGYDPDNLHTAEDWDYRGQELADQELARQQASAQQAQAQASAQEAEGPSVLAQSPEVATGFGQAASTAVEGAVPSQDAENLGAPADTVDAPVQDAQTM